MRWWITAAMLAVAGCSGNAERDAGIGEGGVIEVRRTCTVDDAPLACDPGGTGSTRVYAIGHLVFPEATFDGVEPGFDLDLSDEQVCGADDWIGDPPLAAGCGVDNQFGPFLSIFAGLQDALDAGRLVLLLVVGGIDDV